MPHLLGPAGGAPPNPCEDPDAVTLRPDGQGNVTCPVCGRVCALPYFVAGHRAYHRFDALDPAQRVDMAVVVQVTVSPVPLPRA